MDGAESVKGERSIIGRARFMRRGVKKKKKKKKGGAWYLEKKP